MKLMTKGLLCMLLPFLWPIGIYWIYMACKIKSNVKQIAARYQRIREQIKKRGLLPNEHFSCFGHQYLEYRNDYKAIDNVHIELDDENKKIITYALEPYEFRIHDYSEIKCCLVEPNLLYGNTKVCESILVKTFFYDGYELWFSANDNVRCNVGDLVYTNAMKQAEQLVDIINKRAGLEVKKNEL